MLLMNNDQNNYVKIMGSKKKLKLLKEAWLTA